MGHRAINSQPLVLEPMIEGTHVIEAFYLEGDLLDIMGFFARGLWPVLEPVHGAQPPDQR
jgi:hypothetical protein